MLHLWRLFQGGMGAGHLPEGPASMDQSVKMMEAFAIMSAFENELQGSKRPGSITKADVSDIRASIDRALEIYPDGKASGALLDAVRKSRGQKAA
ncbi:hypothetical protein ABNQ39_11465 [Azospirillum sp. A26]|uniref:hypothetical protein n=1 Tax=Azospirillum sp. A26 TaxID=3160607 RepID=UPI00366EF051